MRGAAAALALAAVISTGCGGDQTAEREPGASDVTPAATPAASAADAAPDLPHLPGEVLAVTRGSATTFMTLDGREIGRLSGYSAWTSAGPLLQKGSRLWTLRDGDVAPVRERWDLRVRGYGDACGVLGRIADSELLSCSSVAGGAQPLLVRRPRGHARPLVPPLGDVSGQWRNAFVSPDGRRLLLTWGAECEVPVAVVAPASGGRASPVTGGEDWTEAPESVALGWTRDGRALVHLVRGACGSGASRPGIYAFDPGGGRTTVTGAARSAAFFPG